MPEASPHRMTLEEFRASLKHAEPPASLSLPLTALWWDARGDWTRAHQTVNSEESVEGMWVHAHLHRKEGDTSNAEYWYRRARKPHPTLPFAEEAQQILKTLLS